MVLKIFSSLLSSQYPSALHTGRTSEPSALHFRPERARKKTQKCEFPKIKGYQILTRGETNSLFINLKLQGGTVYAHSFWCFGLKIFFTVLVNNSRPRSAQVTLLL